MSSNGKFQRPNLCHLSLWNAMMQCKFPPGFFVFRYCSLLSKCWISRYSGFWVFRSAHFLQGIAVCFLLDSPIKNQYSTSCGERGASESFIHLNWSIVSLQCFVGFCWTIKWISYAYPYVPFLPLPHSTLLGHHRAPGWAPWAIQQLPTSSPFHTRQCTPVSVTLSICPILPLPSCIHKSILYIYVPSTTLQIGLL